MGARTRPRARPPARHVARGVLGRSRPGRRRIVARAPPVAITGSRSAASRHRLACARRHARHLRRAPNGRHPATGRAWSSSSRSETRPRLHNVRVRAACEHGHERRGSRCAGRCSKTRSIRSGDSGCGSSEGRGPGLSFAEGARRRRSRARRRAVARERRHRPARSAGPGGRRASSTVPQRSSGSAGSSMPPKGTRSGRSGSPSASATDMHMVFTGAELAIIAAAARGRRTGRADLGGCRERG